MVDMLARKCHLQISSPVLHLTNHTPVKQKKILQVNFMSIQEAEQMCGTMMMRPIFKKYGQLTYQITTRSDLSWRFFLEKNPHLYFVTGSNEICSWERPRLWVPTASPRSNNSCQTKLASDRLPEIIKRGRKMAFVQPREKLPKNE
jgi:hypothetical protein